MSRGILWHTGKLRGNHNFLKLVDHANPISDAANLQGLSPFGLSLPQDQDKKIITNLKSWEAMIDYPGAEHK
jgi:hypothetical protein